MKSKILLFIIIFITKVDSSFGQDFIRDEIVKHKIKSITTIDPDGKVKSIDYFNAEGFLIKKGSVEDTSVHIDREFIYNKFGQLIEERAFTSGAELNSVEKHSYNSQNQLIGSEHSDAGGEFKSTWKFDYDDKGNKVKETQISGTMGNSETIYKYDDNSLLIEEEKSNNTIGKEVKVSYRYNEKKQLIEKKSKHFYGGATITLTYSYNDFGKVVKILEKSSNGVSATTAYEYNSENLLISQSWRGSFSKTLYLTTYRISRE